MKLSVRSAAFLALFSIVIFAGCNGSDSTPATRENGVNGNGSPPNLSTTSATPNPTEATNSPVDHDYEITLSGETVDPTCKSLLIHLDPSSENLVATTGDSTCFVGLYGAWNGDSLLITSLNVISKTENCTYSGTLSSSDEIIFRGVFHSTKCKDLNITLVKKED